MVTYNCERCDKEFDHKTKYVKHINRKYSCTTNKNNGIEINNFKSQNALRKSAYKIEIGEIITVKNKYKCYFCDFVFDNLDLLERHCKLACKCNNLYNNIYKFDAMKLAKCLYILKIVEKFIF